MQTITITLDEPIGRLISHASRSRNVSLQKTTADLLELGFKAFLSERYRHYRRGEVSFGRLAEELGMTTWELSHLLEDQGWPASNLPAPEWPEARQPNATPFFEHWERVQEQEVARVAEDDVTYIVQESRSEQET